MNRELVAVEIIYPNGKYECRHVYNDTDTLQTLVHRLPESCTVIIGEAPAKW